MIIDYSPFFNEHLVSSIKLNENKKWMDGLAVVEADRSFSYDSKQYDFACANDTFVNYTKLNATKGFSRKKLRITRNFPYFKYSADKWKNESIQRNALLANAKPSLDDILILSDIDEIIDPLYSNYILNEVSKHGIVTVKLRFTMFYFNLRVVNWGGPSDYSYRVFVMTGDYYNNFLKYSSDKLRKLGESGHLIDKINCLDQVCGFHHSWVGDAEFIKRKIASYAHSSCDHDPRLYSRDGSIDANFISKCLHENKSIFGDQYKLVVDNEMPLLDSVFKLKELHPEYFVK